MRPIAMTTLAAILALPHLALGIGQGAAMQQPPAVAIISGLAVQFFLVLIVLPVFLVTRTAARHGPMAQASPGTFRRFWFRLGRHVPSPGGTSPLCCRRTTLLLLGILGLQLWYDGNLNRVAAAAPPVSSAATTASADLIVTAQPSRRDFHLTAPWMGQVESRQDVPIIALEAARIVAITAADEAAVPKGAALITLGGPQVQGRLARMQTRINALRQRLELAQQRVAHKRQAVAEKVAPVDELLQAQDALTQIQADLTTAIEDRQVFSARLTLLAPIAAVFTQRRISIGQDVDKGTVLATLLDPSHLRIVATLFPPLAVPLRGRPAMVEVGTGPPLTAAVARVLLSRTRTGGTRLWIEGEAINRSLRPGQALRGILQLETHAAALAVPRSALVYDERETPYVFLKRDQHYAQQQVQTGLTADGWVEILTGIDPTDEVVTQGAYGLFYQNFSHTYKVAD